MTTDSIEDRFRELEERVATLEANSGLGTSSKAEAKVLKDPTPADQPDDGRSLVTMKVDLKRFVPGEYGDDRIDLDMTLTLSPDSEPTRAVKGHLVFTDIFGDPQFRIGYTLNDPLSPDVPIKVKEIGFKFNQFLSEHTWMLGTELSDMKYYFDVKSVIHQDGTTQNF